MGRAAWVGPTLGGDAFPCPPPLLPARGRGIGAGHRVVGGGAAGRRRRPGGRPRHADRDGPGSRRRGRRGARGGRAALRRAGRAGRRRRAGLRARRRPGRPGHGRHARRRRHPAWPDRRRRPRAPTRWPGGSRARTATRCRDRSCSTTAPGRAPSTSPTATSTATDLVGGVGRWLGFAGTLTAVGAVALALLLPRPTSADGRARPGWAGRRPPRATRVDDVDRPAGRPGAGRRRAGAGDGGRPPGRAHTPAAPRPGRNRPPWPPRRPRPGRPAPSGHRGASGAAAAAALAGVGTRGRGRRLRRPGGHGRRGGGAQRGRRPRARPRRGAPTPAPASSRCAASGWRWPRRSPPRSRPLWRRVPAAGAGARGGGPGRVDPGRSRVDRADRAVAVVSDLAHLGAVAVWVGGLVALLVALPLLGAGRPGRAGHPVLGPGAGRRRRGGAQRHGVGLAAGRARSTDCSRRRTAACCWPRSRASASWWRWGGATARAWSRSWRARSAPLQPSLRIEMVVAALVLALTAALIHQPPARATVAHGPVDTTARGRGGRGPRPPPSTPPTPGPNDIHLYFSGPSGTEPLPVDAVQVTAGTTDVPAPALAGDPRQHQPCDCRRGVIALPGTWTVEVTAVQAGQPAGLHHSRYRSHDYSRPSPPIGAPGRRPGRLGARLLADLGPAAGPAGAHDGDAVIVDRGRPTPPACDPLHRAGDVGERRPPGRGRHGHRHRRWPRTAPSSRRSARPRRRRRPLLRPPRVPERRAPGRCGSRRSSRPARSSSAEVTRHAPTPRPTARHDGEHQPTATVGRPRRATTASHRRTTAPATTQDGDATRPPRATSSSGTTSADLPGGRGGVVVVAAVTAVSLLRRNRAGDAARPATGDRRRSRGPAGAGGRPRRPTADRRHPVGGAGPEASGTASGPDGRRGVGGTTSTPRRGAAPAARRASPRLVALVALVARRPAGGGRPARPERLPLDRRRRRARGRGRRGRDRRGRLVPRAAGRATATRWWSPATAASPTCGSCRRHGRAQPALEATYLNEDRQGAVDLPPEADNEAEPEWEEGRRRRRLRLARPPHPLDGREPPAGRRAGRRRAGVDRAASTSTARPPTVQGELVLVEGVSPLPWMALGLGRGAVVVACVGRRRRPLVAAAAVVVAPTGALVVGWGQFSVAPAGIGRQPAAGGRAAGRAGRRRARPGLRGPDRRRRSPRWPARRRRPGVGRPAGRACCGSRCCPPTCPPASTGPSPPWRSAWRAAAAGLVVWSGGLAVRPRPTRSRPATAGGGDRGDDGASRRSDGTMPPPLESGILGDGDLSRPYVPNTPAEGLSDVPAGRQAASATGEAKSRRAGRGCPRRCRRWPACWPSRRRPGWPCWSTVAPLAASPSAAACPRPASPRRRARPLGRVDQRQRRRGALGLLPALDGLVDPAHDLAARVGLDRREQRSGRRPRAAARPRRRTPGTPVVPMRAAGPGDLEHDLGDLARRCLDRAARSRVRFSTA